MMRSTFQNILCVLFLLFTFKLSPAQKPPPFWYEIQAFKKQDSINFPGKHKILFTGSSSFRMWKDVQNYFPGYQIINRGFGGSTLVDMIKYVNDIIYPYEPKQVFIYCGENDLASSDTIRPGHVLSRFKILFALIRDRYPKLEILFLSIKPSPSRRHLLPAVIESNQLIKQFLKSESKTKYIDVFNKMLMPDGNVRTDIWLVDSLHMNAEGYKIWQKVLKPYLAK